MISKFIGNLLVILVIIVVIYGILTMVQRHKNTILKPFQKQFVKKNERTGELSKEAQSDLIAKRQLDTLSKYQSKKSNEFLNLKYRY